MSYQQRLNLYEQYKKKIASQGLSPEKYQQAIKDLAKRLNL